MKEEGEVSGLTVLILLRVREATRGVFDCVCRSRRYGGV